MHIHKSIVLFSDNAYSNLDIPQRNSAERVRILRVKEQIIHIVINPFRKSLQRQTYEIDSGIGFIIVYVIITRTDTRKMIHSRKAI